MSLVREIVDGEDGRHAIERGIVGVERLQIDGKEPGLPVVRVKDVGPVTAASTELEDGAAEEGETELVVAEVSLGIAVDSLTVEERRMFDEDHAQSGREFAFVEAGA